MKARFLLSKSKTLEQYRTLMNLADEVSYSVKTNPALVEILEENTDSNFSIHFVNSIDYVKDKKRIWFLAQSWKEDDIDFLMKKGINSFTVDNENDLNVLMSYLGRNNCRINLLLRMRLKERSIRTERHFVFGMYSSQINKLIPELRESNKIDKLGIHFYRRTQNIGEWYLKDELEQILNERTLEKIDVMNIGGGIPIEYRSHRVDTLPHIFEQIRKLKQWLDSYGVKMIIEPGRFISGPSVKLETEITNIYNNDIVVNCSVYNSAMDTFVAHVRLLVEGEGDGEAYTIKGCTPCSMDVFRYRVYLDNPKIGDKIVFVNAGAYIYSTDFCNLDKLETIVVD